MPNPLFATYPRFHAAANSRIWFVNEVVRTGHYIEDISDDDALLFDTICTQIGLGDSPTIVFDPRLAHPEIRFYPDGLSIEDKCIVHAISDTEVSPDTINRVVERIYESSFITPDAEVPGASSVWQNSRRCWPSRNAEARIQAHLKTGLYAHFFDCDVRHEQPSKAGRLDLEIERPDPNDYFTITRNLSTTLRHWRLRFTEQSLLLWMWMWQVG